MKMDDFINIINKRYVKWNQFRKTQKEKYLMRFEIS